MCLWFLERNDMTDALGNEIIQGNMYGYSRNDGGFSHNTVGVASGESKGKVKLTQLRIKRFLYGEPTDFREWQIPDYVYISSNQVFPVNPKDLHD